MFISSKTTLALAALTILTFVSQAKADHIANPAFSQAVETLNQPTQTVQAEAVFDKGANQSALSLNEIGQLTTVAKSQAEIWGDTILEGDYQANGQAEVDHVDALKVNGQVIAYRVLYSERSWDTSTCTSNAASSLDECQEGRIQEASFVSTDLSSWIRDPKQFAVFLQK